MILQFDQGLMETVHQLSTWYQLGWFDWSWGMHFQGVSLTWLVTWHCQMEAQLGLLVRDLTYLPHGLSK